MPSGGAIDLLFRPAGGACSAPELSLSDMDEAGVAVAFLTPCTQLTCERQWACVDTRLEDVARYMTASIRFAGLCGYNPFDAAESFREMDAARALGFRGVFVQLSAFGLPLGDSRYYPMFAKASELQFPAVVQCSKSEPAEADTLRRIGRDFPDLSLAVAMVDAKREVFEAAADFESLSFVLNTTALAAICRRSADLLEDPLFTERCMWGSDGAPLTATLGEARALPISEIALPQVLHANALRFFESVPHSRLPRSLDESITTVER